MSDARLSSSTRALLRAAKGDGPSAAARANVWAGVSSAVGGAAGAGGAAGSSGAAGAGGASMATSGAAAGLGAAKVLALGTLLGGTVTVGLAVALLRVVPVPAVTATASAPIAATSTSTSTSLPTPRAADATANPFPPAHPIARPSPVRPPTASDPLAREAALVAAARAALARQDATTALRDVRVARSLPSHQLTPEELAVEAQALRALGRDDEADHDDALLRTQYPESALAP